MLLSRRESGLLKLMGKGLSRAEIADRLGVSRNAECFHQAHASKFRLKTSLQPDF